MRQFASQYLLVSRSAKDFKEEGEGGKGGVPGDLSAPMGVLSSHTACRNLFCLWFSEQTVATGGFSKFATAPVRATL